MNFFFFNLSIYRGHHYSTAPTYVSDGERKAGKRIVSLLSWVNPNYLSRKESSSIGQPKATNNICLKSMNWTGQS